MADLPYRVFEWRGDEQPQFVAIFPTLTAMGWPHKEYERTGSFSRGKADAHERAAGHDSSAKLASRRHEWWQHLSQSSFRRLGFRTLGISRGAAKIMTAIFCCPTEVVGRIYVF